MACARSGAGETMTDEEKQRAYEERRAKIRPIGMEGVPKILYRIWMPDGTVFTERSIGPSVICAHYPQLVALRVVQEPEEGMMMELW